MDELTFDKAVQVFMEKVFQHKQDQDYFNAVDTILYLWDQDRANAMNKAVLPSEMYKEVEGGELYLLVRISPLRYLNVKRDRSVKVVQYGH